MDLHLLISPLPARTYKMGSISPFRLITKNSPRQQLQNIPKAEAKTDKQFLKVIFKLPFQVENKLRVHLGPL